jgi:hypothetical protein
MSDVNIKDIIGQTFKSVTQKGNSEIWFENDNVSYVFYHGQDCCESVYIDDVNGDLSDLAGSPITMAEEESSRENPEGIKPPEYQDSFTWTFYKFATVKGYVTVRWYGESNGYYSESVDIRKIENK